MHVCMKHHEGINYSLVNRRRARETNVFSAGSTIPFTFNNALYCIGRNACLHTSMKPEKALINLMMVVWSGCPNHGNCRIIYESFTFVV